MGQQSKQLTRALCKGSFNASPLKASTSRAFSDGPSLPASAVQTSSSRTLHESLAARAANVSPPLCECPVIASYFARERCANAPQTIIERTASAQRSPLASGTRAPFERRAHSSRGPRKRKRHANAARTLHELAANATQAITLRAPREHCTNATQVFCKHPANVPRMPSEGPASVHR